MTKINDSLRFVLPMLYNTELGFNDEFFFNDYLLGVFTSDVRHPEYDDNIILVYRESYDEDFMNFDYKLQKHLAPEVYRYEEWDVIMYVIPIPKNYVHDYISLSIGDYDQLSPNLKLNIVKMWTLIPEDELFKIIMGEEEYEGEENIDNNMFDIENL